ncbi:tripartite tricarboxylate transporter substrate binding protein [Variovorax sp. dw_308]|uniref:Bug family tripartite tricarboxylate transporter substrate binding protein n=1 Tax=Variovorax sp. dw_308 TaxID=2721546 RepID=UPI001C474CAF|nr:tripartite tricarboxylate transporter substrate-binding protein [Variovorax sp. dw_308]
MPSIIRTCGLVVAFALPIATSAAYPDKPIHLVVPYAAGGPTDAMARILQGPLQQALGGATIVVENVPGVGGALGAQQVLRAPADGYTLFLGNNGPSAVTPLLQKNAGFDPVKDFAPISMVARSTMVLAVSSAVPATNMSTFLDWARKTQGKANYASAGVGSLGHLGTELLIKQAGIKMTHVPYKGQAPTLNALMGGEVQVLLTTPTEAMRGQIATGRIKLVGVTSDTTSPHDPKTDVVGKYVPGYSLYSWFALLAKAGTPPAVVEQLHAAVVKAVASEDVRKRFDALGVDAESSAPAQVMDYVKQDVARWSVIIREQNIEPE